MELTAQEPNLGAIFFAALLAMVVFWMAERAGFFRLPPPSRFHPVSFLQTFGAFLIYLAVTFVVTLIARFVMKQRLESISLYLVGWFQFSSLCILFLTFIVYCTLIEKQARRFLFWGEGPRSRKRFFKSFAMGVLACAISYPFVLLVNVLASMLSTLIWGETLVEQLAVEQLKNTSDHPLLFGLMIFAVVILVPFMEELLFRGFLQSLLKRYLKRGWAILVTAFFFALVHFAKGQGVGNFQLILSLFVLSWFLGFIYEREQTLWAPIALHMTFNGMSALFIVFQN